MRMRRLQKLAQRKRTNHDLHIQLGVLVLAVGLEVLADGNSLLDEHVKVLGDLRSEA
jgi:hypothetical protein